MNTGLSLMRSIYCKFNPFRVDVESACSTVNFIYGYCCSILSGLLSRSDQNPKGSIIIAVGATYG